MFTGKTNNQMLKQMMDVSGGFPRAVAFEGTYSRKHFNSDGDFLFNKDPDSITGEPDVLASEPLAKPAKPVFGRLQAILATPALGMEQAVHDKWLVHLAELVKGCVRPDAEDRIEPFQALEMPFFAKDR